MSNQPTKPNWATTEKRVANILWHNGVPEDIVRSVANEVMCEVLFEYRPEVFNSKED